jgi:anaerobic magnesium-protoporphyrin IX monomethyl ester cyclase
VAQFLFDTRLLRNGPTLREFLGPTLVEREYALARGRRIIPVGTDVEQGLQRQRA